jgi:hypothetical protein
MPHHAMLIRATAMERIVNSDGPICYNTAQQDSSAEYFTDAIIFMPSIIISHVSLPDTRTLFATESGWHHWSIG